MSNHADLPGMSDATTRQNFIRTCSSPTNLTKFLHTSPSQAGGYCHQMTFFHVGGSPPPQYAHHTVSSKQGRKLRLPEAPHTARHKNLLLISIRLEIQMSNTKDTKNAKQQTSSRDKGAITSTTNIDPTRVRSTHRRRERPRKLRVFEDELPHSQDIHEPDINSFVSTCAPGISFGNNNDDNDTTGGDNMMSTRRPTQATPVHQRCLPSLSFLATTTIAAEKKKLKIEEDERKERIAEMDAQKALALNPIDSIEVGETKEDKRSSNVNHQNHSELQSTTVDKNTTSNVTMPPLLEQFLANVNKGDEKGEVEN